MSLLKSLIFLFIWIKPKWNFHSIASRVPPLCRNMYSCWAFVWDIAACSSTCTPCFYSILKRILEGHHERPVQRTCYFRTTTNQLMCRNCFVNSLEYCKDIDLLKSDTEWLLKQLANVCKAKQSAQRSIFMPKQSKRVSSWWGGRGMLCLTCKFCFVTMSSEETNWK